MAIAVHSGPALRERSGIPRARLAGGPAQMQIQDTRTYIGPNIWANFPVIELTLDLGPLEQWPTGRLGVDFQQRLLSLLPGLREHRCSYGVPGGFVRRLTHGEGTWLGHVLEHTAIELQCMAGFSVSFGRARSVPGRSGVYHVVYEYKDAEVGRAAGKLALDLLHSLLPSWWQQSPGVAFDFQQELSNFMALARGRMLGPSTAALVHAAERRHIPWERLDGDHLIQLGYGARQRRIKAALTDNGSHIAIEIAQDKWLTRHLLAEHGIPVPLQHRVQNEDEAVAAAERLGFPVVVKPIDGNQGRGVSANVSNAHEAREAYREAFLQGSGVIVESQIAGSDHRLLVVGGVLVAAARRIPGHVLGDGSSSVEALVERVNADPRRADNHDGLLTRLELDEEADRLLARRGYTRASVPEAGEPVYLRSTANLSRGGTATDVTDQVHPDNRTMAERAANAVGLDVAGIDFITPDISRSHLEGNGAVCEVNAAPGLRMHMSPVEGQPRDVAEAIIEQLFPDGSSGRIPIAAITGTNGKTTTAHMVAAIATAAKFRVGLTTTLGVYIRGRKIVDADASGPGSARMILRDPTVDIAVLETARGGILREGLGFRHCNVGAVLNVTDDHLGLSGIYSAERMAVVKRTVAEVATDVAVLNADDPLCLQMIEHTAAATVCLVSMRPQSTAISGHLAAGGSALVLETNGRELLVFRSGSTRTPLLATTDIPATHNGRVRVNVQNAMFAAAIALGMGLDAQAVRAGLGSFDTTVERTPGRFNVYDGHPFRVIMDYGHNPAAVAAICDSLRYLARDARKICVLAAPGDRRNEEIRGVAKAAAGHCDTYICRRDDALRGRGPDEVPHLLREGLLAEGVPGSKILVIPDEVEAIATALSLGRPGDLLLLFADDLPRTWKQIVEFRPYLNFIGTQRAWLPALPAAVSLRT